MERPTPTAEHRRLEKLAGIWKGRETIPPSPFDPAGHEAEGTTRARIALDGFAVIVDYEQTCSGRFSFSGHGVYTWDAEAREVVLHWFDCTCAAREEFRGAWEGDQLLLEGRGAAGRARMTHDYSVPGVLTTRMEMSQDGTSWAPLFHGTYQRVD